MADAGAKDAKNAGAAAEPDAGGGAPAAKSRLRRAIPYLVGGALSAGLGITAGIVTAPHEKPAAPDAAGDPKPATRYDHFGQPFEIVLPTLITNLADPNSSVSGKFAIRLEVRTLPELEATRDKLAADCADKAAGRLYAQIRDTLVTLFQSKVSTEIKTSHGKELLKLEILDLLTPILFPDSSKGVISNVYFEDFVYQ